MPKCCGTDSERWQEVRRESYSFHRDGEALPNADAESGEPISSPARVKLMNQRLHQPRPRHAGRMATRNSSPVGIDMRRIIRSEERRGGREMVSTCRSRGTPYH